MGKPDAVAEKNADKKAASDDNFANGYYEHNKNGAADKGLANALEHNGKGGDDSIVIDFDTGEWTITYQYDYYYYSYMYGTYSEDGLTGYWQTYEDNYYNYWYGYDDAHVDVPFFDADGDGDNEFGVNLIGEDHDDYYYDYEYSYMYLTADPEGDTWASDIDMSLTSMDFTYTPDNSYYYYDYLYLWGSDTDLDSSGSYLTNSYSSAYTYDGTTWNIYESNYDYTTGASTYTSGTTTDMAVVYAMFDSMDYIAVQVSDSFTVDNMVFETEAMAA